MTTKHEKEFAEALAAAAKACIEISEKFKKDLERLKMKAEEALARREAAAKPTNREKESPTYAAIFSRLKHALEELPTRYDFDYWDPSIALGFRKGCSTLLEPASSPSEQEILDAAILLKQFLICGGPESLVSVAPIRWARAVDDLLTRVFDPNRPEKGTPTFLRIDTLGDGVNIPRMPQESMIDVAEAGRRFAAFSRWPADEIEPVIRFFDGDHDKTSEALIEADRRNTTPLIAAEELAAAEVTGDGSGKALPPIEERGPESPPFEIHAKPFWGNNPPCKVDLMGYRMTQHEDGIRIELGLTVHFKDGKIVVGGDQS